MSVFIEEWIYQRIRRKLKDDPEYLKRIGRGCLKEITRKDLEDFQFLKLKKVLHHVTQKSRFYQNLFAEREIRPHEFNSLKDLKKIPLTDPEDISKNPFRFLCVPLGEVARIFTFTTSGTTNYEKRVFFTAKDLDYVIDFFGACARTVGSEKEIIQILLPDGRPHSQADLLARGIRKAGIRAIVTGSQLSSREQVKKIEEFHSSILVGSVSCVYRVTQEARKYQGLKKMGIKTIVTTSEHLPESLREELQDEWNCEVYGHYGLTEMGLGVAIECKSKQGFHINEADLVVEVVDPETGETRREGDEGELVFTTLSREGMPLLRYRTGDLSRLRSEPCECGASTIRRIGEIKRRGPSKKLRGGKIHGKRDRN